MVENSLETIKVNSFIRGYHMNMTRWEPTTRDVCKLMRELSNLNDSKAVAIVRGKSFENEIKPSKLMTFIQII